MKTPLLTFTAIAVALASPASALEKPTPGKSDSRVRFVDYNASDVVDLWTTPGAILTIEFADDETIAGVAVSDSHVLHSDKRKNFLILKPEGCLVPEPIVVLTNLPNGQLRRYTMQIETKPQVCGEHGRSSPPRRQPATHRRAICVTSLRTRWDRPQRRLLGSVPLPRRRGRKAPRGGAHRGREVKKERAKRILQASTTFDTKDPYSGDRNLRYMWRGATPA